MDVLKWKFGIGPCEQSRIPEAPNDAAGWKAIAAESIATPPLAGWRVHWLGHASFLLQGCGLNLLIDPVFSDHCSPFPIPSLRRKVSTPCVLTDLPGVDAVLLTHAHYDHLDLPTLRKLGLGTRLLVPEGHAAWLRKKGFSDVTEVRWRKSVDLGGDLRITATPAQHFTARSPIDRNLAHWCGWLIESPQGSLWHAGDSGYCDAFREIGERHGPIDFGMIPIGAYQPRHLMRPMHLNPDEAVDVLVETRCRRAVAMHWGTFRLTDEPLGEPPLLLAAALESRAIDPSVFVAGLIGQSWEVLPGN